MVQIEISEDAEEMILSYVEWLEARNSSGSGSRFLINFNNYLRRLKKSYPYFIPFPNLILRSKNLFCSSYRQWIVGFEMAHERLIIRAFIHKSRLPV